MKTVSPRVMYIAAIVVVIWCVLWVVALFVGYVAVDWGSPAFNERSVPPPRTY